MRMLNSREGKDQARTMTVVMRDYIGLYLRLKCFTSIAQNLTRLHLLRKINHRLLRYPSWKISVDYWLIGVFPPWLVHCKPPIAQTQHPSGLQEFT